MAVRCLRCCGAWTEARLQLTQDLVEKMVGHRTRLVQSSRAAWHRGEDAAMERHLGRTRRMDAATARLVALAPRGWLLLALLLTGLSLVRSVPSPAELGVALGGILLAWQALQRLAAGVADLGSAVISWRQVAPMLAALAPQPLPAASASEAGVTPPTDVPAWGPAACAGSGPLASASDRTGRLLGARELAFTHARRARPILENVSLDIHAGDRILLQGASGSGKSTLVSLLTGLSAPDAGVVLLRGLDRATLGEEAWRRHIATAPQFHENHVLTETFAFNLLLGRRWPPRPEDVQEAEDLCRDLGLAALLQRMPAGMFEMVGESGWQLSHGERSRLFMARALLQQGELVVLDESFTALDPATRSLALRCALARCQTLLVVAHP
jgi:ATP-binding cassette subfamily B protein